MSHNFDKLLSKSQSGDKQAYREFFNEFIPMLRGFIKKNWSGLNTPPEDLEQDVLMAIHKALPTYSPDRPALPWLFAIARYRIMDTARKHYRTKDVETIVEETDPVFVTLSDDGANNDTDTQYDWDKLLAQLSQKQRDVIYGLKFQEKSLADMALELNMTISAVKVNAHRGYKKLKDLIENAH